MRFLGLTFVALVVLSTGCTSNDESPSPTGPSAVSLDGTWRATRAEFVSLASPTRSTEVVSKGMIVTLQLPTGANYTFTLAEPGAPPYVVTGTWTASKDELTLNLSAPLSGELQFDYVLNGNALTINGGHMLFTFDDKACPEESIVSMTLSRQP